MTSAIAKKSESVDTRCHTMVLGPVPVQGGPDDPTSDGVVIWYALAASTIPREIKRDKLDVNMMEYGVTKETKVW